MALCRACRKDEPDPGLKLCYGCVDRLEKAIVNLAAWMPDLTLSIARATRVRYVPPRHTAAVRLLIAAEVVHKDTRALVPTASPIDYGAVTLRDLVRATLRRWVAETREEQPAEPEPGEPYLDTVRGPFHWHCKHPSCEEIRPRFEVTPTVNIPSVVAGPTGSLWGGVAAGPVHSICGHPSCADIRAGSTSDQRACSWLLTRLEVLAASPKAARALRELERAARRVEQLIDNPDPEIYAGPCNAPDISADLDDDVIRIVLDRPCKHMSCTEIRAEQTEGPTCDRVAVTCGADLYARLGETEIMCDTCGARYPVADRQDWLLDEARKEWARPAMIASALTAMGRNLPADRLDQWISRDKAQAESGRMRRVPYPPILQVGIDDDGKPLFRVGDVMDRLDALAAIAEARTVVDAASERSQPSVKIGR